MDKMHVDGAKFDVYRSILIEKGVVQQDDSGYVKLALPGFAALVEKYKAYDAVMEEET